MKSRTFWVGVFGGAVATVLIGLFAAPATGVLNMSAADGAGFLDWWGNTAWHSSLAWRAPKESLPTSADVQLGLEHFGQACVECHGAPGMDRESWAEHMLPEPPHLWEKDTQGMSDGQLYRILDKGVGRTGMPAFGESLDEHHLWSLVAAIRQLDALTPDQREMLHATEEEHEAHEHP